MLQMRTSDGLLLNPLRDIAQSLNTVILTVADGIEDDTLPRFMKEAEKSLGVTKEDLREGFKRLCSYFVDALAHKTASTGAGISNSGFHEMDPRVQLLLYGYFGLTYFTAAVSGARHATIGDLGPMDALAKLIKSKA